MTKKRTQDYSENNNNQEILIHILTGSAICSILFFLLLLLCAAMILKMDLDSSAMLPSVLICSALAAISGGFTAVRKTRKNGAVLGVISAIPAIAAILIASLIATKSAPGMNMLSVAASMLISSSVGGILAVNIRKKNKAESSVKCRR